MRFSENARGVNATTLRLKNTATGLFVPAVVSYDSATHRATINPATTLRGSRRYVAYAASGITDVAGNALISTNWTFTTRR